MAKRPLQEINAGSMADIAFLLLIFFLVTTTMDTNKGMTRQLPPMPEKDQPQDDVKVKERDVFVVLVNRADQLLVEGQPMDISQLKEKTKEFFDNPQRKENLSDRKIKNIEFFGEVEVSKGVVSLQNDRGTSYKKYIEVQNELVAAINELRDELCRAKFHKPYAELSKQKDDLSKRQTKAIGKYYPLAISEAEPKTYK